MWLYASAGFLLIVGIVGGLLGGGVVTIALIPIAIIIAASGFLYTAWGRAVEGASGGGIRTRTRAPTGRSPQLPLRTRRMPELPGAAGGHAAAPAIAAPFFAGRTARVGLPEAPSNEGGPM